MPDFFRNSIRIPLAALFATMVLSSCTSSNLADGLDSSQQQSAQQLNRPQPTTPQTGQNLATGQDTAALVSEKQPNVATNQTASAVGVGPVAFLPVTGAPQSAVTTLSSSIKSSADEASVAIVGASSNAKYDVKGYFSALDDGNGTLLVYVWDVLDKSGRRVHRISGQERTASKSSDPWQAISKSDIERMSDNTMANLKSWLSSRG